MNFFKKSMHLIFFFCFLLFVIGLASCNNPDEAMPPTNTGNPNEMEEEEDYLNLSQIDLSNWKVTLPIGNPTEVKPPDILDFANNELLKKYMYNGTEDSSLVFFTEPGSTTTNSSYSRTELREQMEPGSNNVNWTFAQGGSMNGTLKVSRVSGNEGNLDRIIVMQIHGRLTNEQRDLIGASDNNAPPVLKIYWDDGKINVRRKILVKLDVSDTEILKKQAWEDDSHWFDAEVGFDEFTIEILAKDDLLEVKLGNGETLSFSDIHVEKWSIFENYFKAGNYLQSSESDTYSEVKYYDLEVNH